MPRGVCDANLVPVN